MWGKYAVSLIDSVPWDGLVSVLRVPFFYFTIPAMCARINAVKIEKPMDVVI